VLHGLPLARPGHYPGLFMNGSERSIPCKMIGVVVDIWVLNDGSAEAPLSPPITNLRLRMWDVRIVGEISRDVVVVG
jgi:hypothetical protein